MKRLIADLYKIVYKVTNAHMASLLFSIAFVSTLNYISLYGIGLLLERNAAAKIIHKLVSFPVSVGTFIVIFLLNLWLMTPLKNLSKHRQAVQDDKSHADCQTAVEAQQRCDHVESIMTLDICITTYAW